MHQHLYNRLQFHTFVAGTGMGSSNTCSLHPSLRHRRRPAVDGVFEGDSEIDVDSGIALACFDPMFVPGSCQQILLADRLQPLRSSATLLQYKKRPACFKMSKDTHGDADATN